MTQPTHHERLILQRGVSRMCLGWLALLLSIAVGYMHTAPMPTMGSVAPHASVAMSTPMSMSMSMSAAVTSVPTGHAATSEGQPQPTDPNRRPMVHQGGLCLAIPNPTQPPLPQPAALSVTAARSWPAMANAVGTGASRSPMSRPPDLTELGISRT